MCAFMILETMLSRAIAPGRVPKGLKLVQGEWPDKVSFTVKISVNDYVTLPRLGRPVLHPGIRPGKELISESLVAGCLRSGIVQIKYVGPSSVGPPPAGGPWGLGAR